MDQKQKPPDIPHWWKHWVRSQLQAQLHIVKAWRQQEPSMQQSREKCSKNVRAWIKVSNKSHCHLLQQMGCNLNHVEEEQHKVKASLDLYQWLTPIHILQVCSKLGVQSLKEVLCQRIGFWNSRLRFSDSEEKLHREMRCTSCKFANFEPWIVKSCSS